MDMPNDIVEPPPSIVKEFFTTDKAFAKSTDTLMSPFDRMFAFILGSDDDKSSTSETEHCRCYGFGTRFALTSMEDASKDHCEQSNFPSVTIVFVTRFPFFRFFAEILSQLVNIISTTGRYLMPLDPLAKYKTCHDLFFELHGSAFSDYKMTAGRRKLQRLEGAFVPCEEVLNSLNKIRFTLHPPQSARGKYQR
jgi:hypothetical protein